MALLLAAAAACREPRATESIGASFVDALNSHDPKRVVALLSAHATYREPGLDRPLDAEQLQEHLARQWQNWHDQVYTARRIYGAPSDAVLVEWYARQTFRNREAFTLEGVFVLELQDDLIASVRSYFDKTPVLRFLARAR